MCWSRTRYIHSPYHLHSLPDTGVTGLPLDSYYPAGYTWTEGFLLSATFPSFPTTFTFIFTFTVPSTFPTTFTFPAP